MKRVKQRKIREIEPLPLLVPLTSFKFVENDNRRNPFKPTSLNNTLVIPNQARLKQPLEDYSLDALKFVGILQQDRKVWALIQLPSMAVTAVRVGDYLGRNEGHIIAITNASIQLIEITQHAGKWEKHTKKMELQHAAAII